MACAFAVAVVLVALGNAPARAGDAAVPPAASERGVKAAFVYKFLSYVEWPPTAFSQADAPIVIGVFNADDFATELQQITAARTVDNRPVVVRRVRDGESLAGLHVLFVGRADAAHTAALARIARERSILVVTDAPGGLDQGGMINFAVVDGRVRFEIAADAADRAGLKLSSRLLAVAINVRTGS